MKVENQKTYGDLPFRFLLFAVICLIFMAVTVQRVAADDKFCKASFVNPLTDIRWEGIFPIEIAGVEIKGIGDLYRDPASEGLETDPDKLKNIICFCKEGPGKFRLGITVSYWEPARVIETTKIPYCFPTLGGIVIAQEKPGKNLKNTAHRNYEDTDLATYNVHYYFFNAFDVIDLFVDLPCSLHEGFDIAYISEIDPMWNNDLLSFVLNPEAILFGNPVAQLACAADSSAAVRKYPLDSLFWCVGSWGSAYPLAGSANSGNPVAASALFAARAIYRNARLGLLWDPGINECYAQLTPVWKKTNYKMHLLKPVKGPIVPIGRTSLLWEEGKNPPFGTKKNSPDNFSWVLFRRVKCCLGLVKSTGT